MTAVSQESQTFNIDASHSIVEFTVRHLAISKVRGRFGKVSGAVTLGPGAVVPTAVDVEIDVSSIETHEEQRNGHLKSADFFDVEKYPTITFKSSSVTGSANRFVVQGDLTILGTKRSVALAASYDGRVTDPWGMDRIAYSADVTIDRREFGMVWNQGLDAGGVLIGTDIKIEITLQVVRPPA